MAYLLCITDFKLRDIYKGMRAARLGACPNYGFLVGAALSCISLIVSFFFLQSKLDFLATLLLTSFRYIWASRTHLL